MKEEEEEQQRPEEDTLNSQCTQYTTVCECPLFIVSNLSRYSVLVRIVHTLVYYVQCITHRSLLHPHPTALPLTACTVISSAAPAAPAAPAASAVVEAGRDGSTTVTSVALIAPVAPVAPVAIWVTFGRYTAAVTVVMMTVSPVVAAGGQRSNNPHNTVETTCACTTFSDTCTTIATADVFVAVGKWGCSLQLASGSEVVRLVP